MRVMGWSERDLLETSITRVLDIWRFIQTERKFEAEMQQKAKRRAERDMK